MKNINVKVSFYTYHRCCNYSFKEEEEHKHRKKDKDSLSAGEADVTLTQELVTEWTEKMIEKDPAANENS